MANAEAFLNRTTLDSDRIISVNLNDAVGSDANFVKFALAIMNIDEDLIVDEIFMTIATAIGLNESFINEGLAILCES